MIVNVIMWSLAGISIIGAIIVSYDKIKHRRLKKKYESEKEQGRIKGSGTTARTDPNITESGFVTRQTESNTISDTIDGTTIDRKQKNSKSSRNPFKRRRN